MSKDEIVVSIFVGFLALMFLATGTSLCVIFFRNVNNGGLILSETAIEMPRRYKTRIRLRFSQVANICEFETYDHVVEIQTEHESYLIEKKWMRKKEFELVRKTLLKRLAENAKSF